MNTPKKQPISRDELLEKIQSLLTCSECRNIHIDSIEVYAEQVDGANWDINRHRRSGDGHDWSLCRSKITAEIKYLRSFYDVSES